MGLDITVWRGLRIAHDVETNTDGDPIQREFFRPGASLTWSEKTWPGRCKELVEDKIYSSTGQFRFRAGSYSGYNEWRSWLATIAGFRNANDYWENAPHTAPFYELINFADNEGVIGASVAAELAKDFAAHQDIVDQRAEEWAIPRYRTWRLACEMAADSGAIEFH